MKTLNHAESSGDKFFGLLEASALQVQRSVKLMIDLIKNPGNNSTLDEFMQTRNKDRNIARELTEELCKTFMTPLASEDIERLSLALYEIPETVEKFSERFLLCCEYLHEVDFLKQISILDQSTDIVVQMIKTLRSRTHIKALKESIDSLHALERESDQLILEQRKELNSSKYDSLKAVTISDLYDTLEEITNACQEAGNAIHQIALKYS